jgi:hypothetical protein
MLKNADRRRAEPVRYVFASRQTHNGNGEANAPNGKAPSAKRRNSATDGATDERAYNGNGQRQTQSRNGGRVLLDERPLVLLPSLAKAVGVNRAIVLQQLHYHLIMTGGREHDGHCWYYSTYEQWQADDFPFWKPLYIRDLFQAMEKEGLLIGCQPEGRKSRRKHYRIDYDKLDDALACACAGWTEIPCIQGRKFRSSLSNKTFNKQTVSFGSLGRIEHTKSTVNGVHSVSFLSGLKEGEREIIQRFNKTFVPKGARPINKLTPALRQILRHNGWGDYMAFEKVALSNEKNWPERIKRRRPGFVALWHAYKPYDKDKRSATTRFGDKSIDDLERWSERLVERCDELYHEDPSGSEKERAELRKIIEAIDNEVMRRKNLHAERTGKEKFSVEAIRMQRAVRRNEREHERVKNEPLWPWEGKNDT